MYHDHEKQSAQAAGEFPDAAVVEAVSYSIIGDRPTQEDAVYISEQGSVSLNPDTKILAVVCDGMGGMADGGRASRTAVQMLRDAFEQVKDAPQVHIPNFLISGIRAIDKTIHGFPKKLGRGSGTTMVAVVIDGRKFYWASVGDSRIYLLRDGRLLQLTRDHNYLLRLQELAAQGQITREEALANRQRDALISFLGIGNVHLMDVNREAVLLQPGDIVLLSSDGMTRVLSQQRIRDILCEHSSAEEKARALVETSVAENIRSQDNTTVAILQYKE